MKDDLCLLGKFEITREILAYLLEHPDAQDTLEGIVQWWLLERKIKYQTAMVKETLEELVEKGLIVEYRNEKSQPRYQLNREIDWKHKLF